MFIGFARVSACEQRLNLKGEEVKRAGCKKIFTDKTCGPRA